jgi:zinc D-Ala-D-Ala dipeptidase
MMPDRAVNPAARDYLQFGAAVLENRKTLENAMLRAGTELGRAILPLPEEWWDFRFMPSYTAQFAPIADADLPPAMRMT